MTVVSFDDASQIFDHATVWVGGHESYWYRRAWEALEKQGETAYKTQYEYYHVLLKALAIVHVYDEFCKYAFEMSDNFSYWNLMEDVIPYFALGQLVARYSDPDEFFDDDEVESGLRRILFDLRYRVFSVIGKELNATDIYTWMYCTGVTPVNHNASVEDADGIAVEAELYEINSYKDYVTMIDEVEEDILFELTLPAYETLGFIESLV